LTEQGLARPALDGKLLRPLTAYLTIPRRFRQHVDDRFWAGALAIEMVHEASLLHDDVLDEASERRGRPTLFATSGVGPALVLGDHLLTSAYRAARTASCPRFLSSFIDAVERTVAGEIDQESSQGKILSRPEYLRIITAKSGELFRAAFSLGPSLLGYGDQSSASDLGARVGRLYQMIDDFLDYCPSIDRGKPPLQDWRQKKWTWPLGLIGISDFDLDESEVLARLSAESQGAKAPMAEAADWIREEAHQVELAMLDGGLESEDIRTMFYGWADMAGEAAEAARISSAAQAEDPSETGAGPESRTKEEARLISELADAARPLDTRRGRLAYFGRHARSFRFASWLFPAFALDKVATVYAFCRFTDDLVDESVGTDPDVVANHLETWRSLAFQAYHGSPTGIAIVDAAMRDMRLGGVPFHYADDLIKGVAMDIRPQAYPTLEALREYSYRVASTVGGWLTELFGVHDPWVLDRAFALGHAMQLTNILRDVGEDLSSDRLYLPADRMAAHGVDRGLLVAKKNHGSPAFPGYRSLMEELMAKADEDYARAFEAIPSLPRFFQGPVAVAARVYQGIHDEIRWNDFDNLTLRARTSFTRKLFLAFSGWRALRKATDRSIRFSPQVAVRSGKDGDGSEVAA
jgi:phytoene synthase